MTEHTTQALVTGESIAADVLRGSHTAPVAPIPGPKPEPIDVWAALDELQATIGAGNRENGFHDRGIALQEALRQSNDPVTREVMNDHVTAKVMLVVTELAEAVEELRSGRRVDEVYYIDQSEDNKGVELSALVDARGFAVNGKPEGFPVEIADAIIRLLDLCDLLNISASARIKEKLAYNAGRDR